MAFAKRLDPDKNTIRQNDSIQTDWASGRLNEAFEMTGNSRRARRILIRPRFDATELKLATGRQKGETDPGRHFLGVLRREVAASKQIEATATWRAMRDSLARSIAIRMLR